MASKPSIEALRQQIRALEFSEGSSEQRGNGRRAVANPKSLIESGGADSLKGAVAAEPSAEPGLLSKDVTAQNKSEFASRRRKKPKRPLFSPGRKGAAHRMEESGSGLAEDGVLKNDGALKNDTVLGQGEVLTASEDNNRARLASNPAPSVATVRYKAMDLLARREQSAVELTRKLSARIEIEAEVIEAVIDQLQAEGLQSDFRMAEAYVRYRSQRGHGPKKIRSELLQKGVAGSVINEALASTDTDWTQLARSQLEKRFGAWGEARNLDARSKAQRSRFLQQRGFDYEHISAAL